MGKKFWFQKSLRRMLVDMHIPDWDERFLKDFSPEHYAEMMRLAKVDTAEIYAGSFGRGGRSPITWERSAGRDNRRLPEKRN